MKKGWVVLNVLCIGIVCMMMTSCTGIFQQKKLESSGQCGDQLNWTYDQKKEYPKLVEVLTYCKIT